MSNTLRISGMATGLDTDSMVKQLMQPYQMKLDSLKQNRTIISWKQDGFRDIISSINTFKSTYFDVLKQDTYMLSDRNLSTYQAKTTDTTNSVNMTPGASALSGDYTIDVAKIAKKAMQTGSNSINIEKVGASFNYPVVIDNSNNTLTVDGTDITLDNKTYNSLSDLASQINTKLTGKAMDSSVKAVVSADGNSISMKHLVKVDSTNDALTVSTADGHKFQLNLTDGNYTLDSLASAINKSLSTTKATDGSTVPSGFQAQVSSDGLSIQYTNGGSDNRNYHIASTATLDSIGQGVASTTVSNPTVNGDTLTYDKRIIKDINDTLTLNINGVRTNITLTPADYTSSGNIADDINAQLAKVPVPGTTDGSMMYTAVTTDTDLLKAAIDTDGKLVFTSNSNFQVSMTGNATSTLGMTSTFSVDQSSSDLMSNIVQGKVNFTINGQTFRYDFSTDTTANPGTSTEVIGAKSKTIQDIMTDISTKAGVDITYSQLTRKFSISSKNTGYDQVINAQDNDVTTGDQGGKFIQTLFGGASLTNIHGQDAEVTITNPQQASNTMHFASNSFVVDNVTYTLSKETTAPVTFSVTSNTDDALKNIKDFISKYNDLIDKINTSVTESRPKSGQYDGYYLPLTDDQKKAMSTDDIKAWEDNGKKGLLQNDFNLSSMLTSLRQAFYETVQGSGISLSEIGLGTSTDLSSGGKIVINDESKLKAALANNPTKVKDLFAKVSTTPYSADHTNYDKRYQEEGIFQRINDILQDNVRTNRDSSGKKGTLIEKAGLVGDYSEFNNILYQQMKDQDKSISDMNDRMSGIENRYYSQFSRLESAMNQLNSQSSWLAQQLGTSSK